MNNTWGQDRVEYICEMILDGGWLTEEATEVTVEHADQGNEAVAPVGQLSICEYRTVSGVQLGGVIQIREETESRVERFKTHPVGALGGGGLDNTKYLFYSIQQKMDQIGLP